MTATIEKETGAILDSETEEAEPKKGTGAWILKWLRENRLPPELRYTHEEIEQQIQENRDAWD